MFNGEVKINKAIIHIIKRAKGNDMLHLSDFELSMDDNLESLFKKYIDKATKESKRLFGTLNINNEKISTLKSIISIYNDTNNFVNESQNITRVLRTAMKSTNAKSTNVLILDYVQGNKKAIAILKLNFSNNYYPKEEILESGKKKITITIDKNGFNELQKMEKIVLIELNDENSLPINIFNNTSTELINTADYFSVLIVDKQDSEASLYWREFLNCTIDDEERKNTREIAKLLSKSIDEFYKTKPKELLEKKSLLIVELNKDEYFNLENSLKPIFSEKEILTIQEEINEKEICTDFKINKEIITQKFSIDTWTVENKINIKGTTSALFEKIDIIKEYDDGTMDIILKGVKKD